MGSWWSWFSRATATPPALPAPEPQKQDALQPAPSSSVPHPPAVQASSSNQSTQSGPPTSATHVASPSSSSTASASEKHESKAKVSSSVEEHPHVAASSTQTAKEEHLAHPGSSSSHPSRESAPPSTPGAGIAESDNKASVAATKPAAAPHVSAHTSNQVPTAKPSQPVALSVHPAKVEASSPSPNAGSTLSRPVWLWQFYLSHNIDPEPQPLVAFVSSSNQPSSASKPSKPHQEPKNKPEKKEAAPKPKKQLKEARPQVQQETTPVVSASSSSESPSLPTWAWLFYLRHGVLSAAPSAQVQSPVIEESSAPDETAAAASDVSPISSGASSHSHPSAMEASSSQSALSAVEERVAAAEKKLAELQALTAGLPQPAFTSEIHQHTYDACIKLGLTSFRMKRAPNDYYEWPLEKRRNFLGAASIHQLCKTILMENTKATVTNCDNPNNSRFYAVIIQYTSRLDTQNLTKFVRSLVPGGSRNNYHFRSAKPADVAKLTNAEFNGVCPVGNKVHIPIILSARLLQVVADGWMWVGGGEPELKLGFPTQDFIDATGCFVADIAEDGLSTDDDDTVKETNDEAESKPEATPAATSE